MEGHSTLSLARGGSDGGTVLNKETGWCAHSDWRVLVMYATLKHYIIAEKVFLVL